MDNDRLFRHERHDADPRHRPNSPGGIQGVPSGNAVKQDNGARVFAAIAIFLFACYFIGALTAHAQEGSPLAKYGTATAAGSSSAGFGSLQVDEP
jgi:hypothetical protein